MRIQRLFAIGLTGLMTVLPLVAQHNGDRSPYSRYGYGSMVSQTTTASRAMGGLSYGLRDGMITNPSNPASYTAVDSLTFIWDVAVSARYAYLSESGRGDGRWLGNFEYATMLLPLSRRVGLSAGLTPLSTTGYEFGSTNIMGGDPNTSEYLRTYSGSGGYNRIYLGVGVNPLGNLHLGTNVSYLFGHTAHSSKSFSTTEALTPVKNERLQLRGLKVDLGAQYVVKLDTTNTRSITLGASVSPSMGFSSEYILTRLNSSPSGTSELVRSDTTRNGSYTLPLTIGLGASYRIANKLMIGADVKYAKWSEARFDNLSARMQDQWQAILGGEYTPNSRGRSPWLRAKYRAGLSFGTSYLNVPNASGAFGGYHELGASAGIGLPLVDRRSAINVSIEYRQLAPRLSGMVREQYIGATIGVVFNESWFRKARVN